MSVRCVLNIIGGVQMNIGFREDLRTEFKSDRNKLSDEIIIEAVVLLQIQKAGSFILALKMTAR